MIGIFPIGILSALSAIGAMPFTWCNQCRTPNACAQVSRCGILDIQQRANEQMRAYWQSNDPNTFDLPPDAVRELRSVPMLAAPEPTEAQIEGEHPPSAAFIDLPYDWKLDRESEGGNCD